MERLFEHHITNASNVTTEVYEQIMSLNKVNSTNFNSWKLKECSLEKELDQVSYFNGDIFSLTLEIIFPHQAAEGTGLAFIVFTQAIVELPGAPFWAIIFFMMLLSLGLGSQIGILEGMLCTIFDIDYFRERIPKPYLTGKLN